MHQLEVTAADQSPQCEQGPHLGARVAHPAAERDGVVWRARALDPGAHDRARRPRDVRLPPVRAKPERQLRDVLRYAPVGRLEGEEDAAHGAGS